MTCVSVLLHFSTVILIFNAVCYVRRIWVWHWVGFPLMSVVVSWLVITLLSLCQMEISFHRSIEGSVYKWLRVWAAVLLKGSIWPHKELLCAEWNRPAPLSLALCACFTLSVHTFVHTNLQRRSSSYSFSRCIYSRLLRALSKVHTDSERWSWFEWGWDVTGAQRKLQTNSESVCNQWEIHLLPLHTSCKCSIWSFFSV